MPRRSQPPDLTVAGRIRARRELHRWTIRHAAQRAGLAHTTWMRIESGQYATDNRIVLAAIAQALDCSVADLVGASPATPDRQVATARAGVSAVLSALVETDLDDPATCQPRPLLEVARDAELIWDLRLRCAYTDAARQLPRVIRELHAHTHGGDRDHALNLFARTADAASFVVRYVGFPGEAWVAAHRARDAARALGDPVILGLGAWSMGHAATGCGAYARALRLAEDAVTDLTRHAKLEHQPEMLGSLIMLAAWSHYALGNRDQSATWAREARTIAERTGDTHTLGLGFGPTNLQCWDISMEVDGGEPGRAVDIARDTNPSVLYKSRRASFYIDTARALTRTGHDDQALRMLLTAEQLTPQRIRASSLVAETARGMLHRGSNPRLVGLCERIGVAEN